MNIGQIKQKVRMLGKNYFGTDADRDPFALDYLIIESANQIARQTDCLVGRRKLSVVAGEADYCSPDLYKIRVIKILSDANNYSKIRIYNYSDQMIDYWRNAGSQLVPDVAVIRGMNAITLLPTPSAAITDGLLVEGFCIPGDNWEYDVNGNPIVNSDTSECPLPVVGHDCLVFLVLYNRAMQMMDANGMAIFNKEYLERLGQLESYAATYARRTV
jgi:hypothetical protein